MHIGLITTLNTNIGDDLIREGIRLVLQDVFPGHDLRFSLVNKHYPLTVYPRWHPMRLAEWVRYLPRGRTRLTPLVKRFEQLAAKLGHSYFDRCNLVVQCGAPVLWPGCHGAEWVEPLWYRVIGRLSQRIPVVNLAAGSAYPWEHMPDAITEPLDASYLRKILDFCRLTTVRDTLAQQLCLSLGEQVPLLPCTAFLAPLHYRTFNPRDDGVVFINYMKGGGHFEWGQGINVKRWKQTIIQVIKRLKTRHKVVFLCHSADECQLAQDIDATVPRLWPKNPQQYFEYAAFAKGAICNRMHASVALAGLGIPSIAVGTDSRLLMVRELGIPALYVKDTTPGLLEEKLEGILSQQRQEQERLLTLQSVTRQRYDDLVAWAIAEHQL